MHALKVFATTALVLASASAAQAALSPCSNLIVNGDFQTGARSPATTSYARDNTMYPETTWNIVSHDTLHPSWADFYDHTTGDNTGFFMIVNGATSLTSGPAWSQQVILTPDTTYTLSAFFASLFPAAVANLQFRVLLPGNESALISQTFTAPEQTPETPLGTWVQTGFKFNSGSSATATVQIFDTSGIFSGNDYAIDDIKLSTCDIPGQMANIIPEPSALALLTPAALLLTRRRKA